MKTKLVKKHNGSLSGRLCVTPHGCRTATGQGTEGGRLQGTWEMQITLNDCAGHVIRSFPSLIEFVAGGTLWSRTQGHRRL